jgi:hypothetical protein
MTLFGDFHQLGPREGVSNGALHLSVPGCRER